MENKLRIMLEKGERPFGTFFELGGANVAEALGQTGLDYIIIDNEHGPFNPQSTLEYVRVAKLYGLTPFVRVPDRSLPCQSKASSAAFWIVLSNSFGRHGRRGSRMLYSSSAVNPALMPLLQRPIMS